MPAKRHNSPANGGRSPAPREDEERISGRARRSALLQLKFGRAAHSLSTIGAVFLAVAAIIAFYLSGSPTPWLESTKWFFPLIAGAVMSIVVMYLKWNPFMTDRTSKQFIVSLISMIVPLLMIILVVLNDVGYVDVGTGSWIYPISFIGISLSLISIAMIWDGMSRRKIIAIVAAAVPLAIMSLPLVAESTGILDILPLVYLGSAVCIQLSGSMMHVMSTSTSVQEREILKASDAKIIAIRDDAEKRQEELDYKEKALLDREIAFETFDKALGDLKADLDQRKRQVELLEEDLAARDKKLREERERTAGAVLSLSTREERLQQRDLEVSSRDRELEAITLALQSKEERLKEDANRLQQEQTNLKVEQKQFKERQELIQEELATLKVARESLQAEQGKLAEKAKELQLKESSLDMRLRSAESAKSISSDQVGRLRQWEEKLLRKEERLADAESELAEKLRSPEQMTKEAELKMASADERLGSIEAKERELLEREGVVSRYENEISSGRDDLQQKMMEIDTLKQEAFSKKQKYDVMLERLTKRAEDLSRREGLIQSGSTTLDTRERAVRASLDRLDKERSEMETQRRTLLELEKTITARSSQLQMREIELRERHKGMEATLGSEAPVTATPAELMEELRRREQTIDLRERDLADREREARRRAYTAAKPGEPEPEAESAAEKAALKVEKVGTGTKRLDDLLYGGLPHGSSVLFVGPPYSGKEIGILAFLADGLRNGIPAIVVTTSRTPDDLVRDFAPILPTLLEVERLGLVRWIDATAGDSQKRESAQQRKNYIKVDGPDDFPGIIEAIEKMTRDIRQGHYQYFKLGYLSLSTSISHTDEMESTKFIQAMARSVRDYASSAMFALERGMHTEQQIESIQHLMDGALMIKLDKQKTYMSVLGIGEAQTRDWIEFKHTSAGLIIGAFSLERIR
jgi:KaiC/GvpD/RAD55 family RecA-like ATPase